MMADDIKHELARLQHPKETFGIAVDILATSRGSLRQRLEDAYLAIVGLPSDVFPDPDWNNRLRTLLSALTHYGPWVLPGGKIFQGSVRHTLSRRRGRTLERFASEFTGIYFAVMHRILFLKDLEIEELRK
jgi:hypothetical protein